MVLVKTQQVIYRNTQIDYEIHLEIQRTWNRQNNSKKSNKVGDLTLADFETHYKPKLIKLGRYCGKGQQIMELESSQVYRHIHNQLTFDKSIKITQCAKKRLFSKWS